MPKVIEVIYEDGVFKPLEKVNLKEGEKLKIKIEREIDNLLDKYCGLLESKITLEEIKRIRGELREWRKF